MQGDKGTSPGLDGRSGELGVGLPKGQWLKSMGLLTMGPCFGSSSLNHLADLGKGVSQTTHSPVD